MATLVSRKRRFFLAGVPVPAALLLRNCSNDRQLEYAGLSFDEPHDWGWVKTFHPDDLNGVVELLLINGYIWRAGEIEARLPRFDAGYCWLLFRTIKP